jgi:hypothetical protein
MYEAMKAYKELGGATPHILDMMNVVSGFSRFIPPFH